MVEVMSAPGGRGMMPNVPEPLLSVDAMDGCRIRSMLGPEIALRHAPNVTV